MAATPELPAAAETVLTFLESVGHRAEAELYLRLFRQLPKESFAVIAAEAQLIRHAAGSLTEQLQFLSQLGLVAPVVVGLFDPSAAAGSAERLSRRLPTVGLESTVVDAEDADLSRQVRALLRKEQVPVVRFRPHPGVDVHQRMRVVAELCRDLGSRKLVLMRRRGGLSLRGGRRMDLQSGSVTERGGLSLINLRTDADALAAGRALSREDQALLDHVRDVLAVTGPSLLVSVTAPFDLAKELFTVRGAGTLVRAGSDLERHADFSDVDAGRLTELLEASFGRRLRPGFFATPPHLVLLERSYRAAAVVHRGAVGPYLSKFAVEPVAQGEGMGHDLWKALCRELPVFYWRTRAENPISKWYSGVADGLQRGERWHVFWRGLGVAAIPAAIADAEAQPDDFEPRVSA